MASVTMKGGMRSRVMDTPEIRPQQPHNAMPPRLAQIIPVALAFAPPKQSRSNSVVVTAESAIRGENQALRGAAVVLTGDVSEFGRRVTGDTQFFGILGYGKKQLAYAKVSLNVVDVRTSEVIYAVQGAGEYELSNREVVGFGTVAGYDATLNGKVLNLAITDAVNKLVAALEAGAWHPSGRS
jgi:curli biogenesis system outer membrane secretion channel CsgG